MAWIDKLGEFSDAQALTATAVSTNVVDLSQDRDVGVGHPLWICVTLDVAADATNANETYTVDLQTDDNSGFSSATTLQTLTITRGSAAGSKFFMAVPQDNERFVRLNYTLGGTTPSVTLSAWVQLDEPPKWQAYPDATN